MVEAGGKIAYCENMKNITVSLSDDAYRQARVKAAQAGRSLSSIVREHLESFGHEPSEFERLKAQEHRLREKMDAAGRGLKAAGNLSRDDLHDRHLSR